MESEENIRIQILKDVRDYREQGGALGYNKEPELSVARELLHEGLVTGSDSQGFVGLTGIRDAGLEHLKAQTPVAKR